MDKEKAEKTLNETVESVRFCPLIKDKCRDDCRFWVPGRIANRGYDINPEGWSVESGYCSCYCLVGGE